MALLKPLGKVIAAPLKALGIVSTPGKAPTPLRSVTRDDAAAQVATDDEIRRRQGAAADIITGARGAEATLTGGKLTLG
ncbi:MULTISPECIES: hypothetical protein [unclassified Sphingomonas]|uniref:hypothetical protein n=1 Tax=unclassified Sphingomonas TaxID=196159 RepID=UPI0006F359B1|nr:MULTISPECIES: hypothetical protein [unclassified Sphingomonas]KQM60073.1 hypothetical protein ASE65_10225 [Sphingomonas sp. Leaf16]KQN11471.1 hypothetical protein ASE81_11210 [Sphingomonas sp. Leaf29]KQN18793.1 hypothetical protein ASE83_11150 [Sphingomonas sp. Leaf32]